MIHNPGSPPQVRGKLTDSISSNPACEDHPRRCGENRELWLYIIKKRGSPPQVRGKRQFASEPVVAVGITPAGAGKTDGFLKEIRPVEDHPRRCGENMI